MICPNFLSMKNFVFKINKRSFDPKKEYCQCKHVINLCIIKPTKIDTGGAKI